MHDIDASKLQSPAPASAPRVRRAIVVLLRFVIWFVLSVALFAAFLFLYTRYNTFPADYHPDEGSKVRQILSAGGDRNFNHPQLMLEATLLVMRTFHVPPEPAQTVVAGRWASAILAAMGATALSWVGFHRAGFGGMVLVGAAVGLCAPMLESAHFMKEDASLLGGVAAAVSMSFFYAMSDRYGLLKMAWAALMGVGVALACSGKYVGLVTILPALVVLLVCCRRQWVIASTIAFTVFAAGTYGGINYRAIQDLDGFFGGFEHEQEHSQTEHSGLTMSKPNGFFVDATLEETQPHVKVLGVVALLAFLPSFRSRRAWDVVVPIGFPLLFLAVLSWSVIPFSRYVLPVVLLGYFLAALGVLWTADVVALKNRKWAGVVVWAGAAVVLALQLPVCLTALEGFAFDSRDLARNWVAAHLPRHTLVVADEYAMLDRPAPWLDRTPSRRADVNIQSPFFAPDLGSVDDMKRRGVKYVVVCSTAFDRFFSPHVRASIDESSQLNRRRRWYEQVFREGTLLWQSDRNLSMRCVPADPDIRVYQIDSKR